MWKKNLKIALPALVVGVGAWLLYLYNTPYIAYAIAKPVNSDDKYIEHFMVSYWHPKLSILPVPAKYRNLAHDYNERGLETKLLITKEMEQGEFIAPYHIEADVSYKDDMTVVTYQGTVTNPDGTTRDYHKELIFDEKIVPSSSDLKYSIWNK